MNEKTPNDAQEPESPEETDGEKLMDFIGGELPPHQAFLRWLKEIEPDFDEGDLLE